MPVRKLFLLVTLALALAAPLTGPTGAQAMDTVVVSTEAPTVEGVPAYGEVLRADPGTWQPVDVTFSYRWLRDGKPVQDAAKRRYRPARADIGHDLSVEVTATSADGQGWAASDEVRVTKGTITNRTLPAVSGNPRFGRTLTADRGSWSREPGTVRYQWLREGQPVPGATRKRYRLGTSDFDRRIAVRVTVRARGFQKTVATSPPTVRIKHRVPVRRTVTYSVRTRGQIVADLGVFRRQAQATLDDPRGWRGSGIEFRRVARGGALTLVLSEASRLPSFSSGCSAQWSCRVGRFVVINQTRWQHASPMWNQRKRSLRDYRHMVVNHEIGHWLGHGHRGCPRRGAAAPIMQTQSKGLAGCRPNPWPTASERRVPRFG